MATNPEVECAVQKALSGYEWAEKIPINITVCDTNAIIVYMNETSQKDGKSIIGNSLFDCHPPHAAEKIRELLASHGSNAYTIEKTLPDGSKVKKMINQIPWFKKDGSYGGIVEMSMVIPFEMPHYIRAPKPQ